MNNYTKEARETEAKAELLKEFYSTSRKLLESRKPCLLAAVFKALIKGDKLAVWDIQGDIIFLELEKCKMTNGGFQLLGKPKKDEDNSRTQCGVSVLAAASSWVKLIR